MNQRIGSEPQFPFGLLTSIHFLFALLEDLAEESLIKSSSLSSTAPWAGRAPHFERHCGLEEYGVRVRSMTEEFDTGTSTGKLILTMLFRLCRAREGFDPRAVSRRYQPQGGGRRMARWCGAIWVSEDRERGEGRLVISEEPIPGFDLSEAEVVRTIYRLQSFHRAIKELTPMIPVNAPDRCGAQPPSGAFPSRNARDDNRVDKEIRHAYRVVQQ